MKVIGLVLRRTAILLLTLCWSLAASALEYPNCPGHLFAIGARLGWAEALVRNANRDQDELLYTHLRAAGAHAQAANAECAQAPPPWPAFQAWRQLQGDLEQAIDQYRRGVMNRSQFGYRIAAWQDGLASGLAHRAFDGSINDDRTCGQLYVRIGAALAYAQTTTQIHRRLMPDAQEQLRDARALVGQSMQLHPECREMSPLLQIIDDAMRHPADDSTVLRVNDLWLAAAQATRFGAQSTPPPPPPVGGTLQDCMFHFWASGSRLGWAEAIARHGPEAMDAVMFEHIAAAGLHVQAANASCAQVPPPWPAWQDWRQVQARLAQMADMYRRGSMSRQQLATAIAALHDGLADRLMWQVVASRIETRNTCEELVVRIGAALGYAQTTTQIHRRLVPEAAAQLQRARQFIEFGRTLRPPCEMLLSLLPSIEQVLRQAGEPGVVAMVDEIWRQGSIVMRPSNSAQVLTPPVPVHAQPGSGAQAIVVSGTLDAAVVAQKNRRALELGYQQSTLTADAVTLEIVPPAAAGQPYIGRISSSVQQQRHLVHPRRPGAQFEEWWQVTVTLGEGQGTLDRLEGPASAVEDYRSAAPDRTNRTPYLNQRWYALRQADGSYRLTMPGISDGIAFRLE